MSDTRVLAEGSALDLDVDAAAGVRRLHVRGGALSGGGFSAPASTLPVVADLALAFVARARRPYVRGEGLAGGREFPDFGLAIVVGCARLCRGQGIAEERQSRVCALTLPTGSFP